MTTWRFAAGRKVAALVPLLLLLVYLPAQSLVRCRMDGLLREVCCCPQDDARESSGPVVKAQGCCDRELTNSQRPTADAARAPVPDFATVASLVVGVVPVSAALGPPGLRFTRAAQRQGPARHGPPIVLLKHAFLI